MRRLAGMTVAALLLLSLLALPALAWHAEGYADCDGYYVTNPEADWNSPDLEMGVFPVGVLVPYGETRFIEAIEGEETRTFWVAWRKIGDGDNWQESRELTLHRDLDECGESTTTTLIDSDTTPPTTEAPPSTDTTTTSTTTPGTSLSTTTTSSTPSTSTTSTVAPTTTPPAPTTTAPGGTSTPETLPFTGPFEDTGLLVVLAVVLIMGGVGLWLLTDDKDDL